MISELLDKVQCAIHDADPEVTEWKGDQAIGCPECPDGDLLYREVGR